MFSIKNDIMSRCLYYEIKSSALTSNQTPWSEKNLINNLFSKIFNRLHPCSTLQGGSSRGDKVEEV